MKKFLAIAMIAASLTACGGGEKTEETPAADSTVAPTETPAAPAVDSAAPAAADTTAKVDSAAAAH